MYNHRSCRVEQFMFELRPQPLSSAGYTNAERSYVKYVLCTRRSKGNSKLYTNEPSVSKRSYELQISVDFMPYFP